MNDRKVLIVDDCVEDIRILMENLKQNFTVVVATSGEKALELLKQPPLPDVALLDVMMPELNGYDLCRQIKSCPQTEQVTVIFVSAHDTTAEKLAGYDAGGEDYVIKPISPQELKAKVDLAIKNKLLRQSLQQDMDMAMETAMTAITSSGELGEVLAFFRQSFASSSGMELAQLLLNILKRYNLSASIQIRRPNETIEAGPNGTISPLETELLTRLKDQGSILEYGARLIVNYNPVSVLIKNLPLSDPDKCGRIRDNVALLVEGAQQRMHSIDILEEIQQHNQLLRKLVKDSKQNLNQIKESHHRHKTKSVSIMEGTLTQLEEAFLHLGLSEDQEAQLLALMQQNVNQSLENFAQSTDSDLFLEQLIEQMEKLALHQ